MSDNVPNDDVGKTCIRCFWHHNRCVGSIEPCCSGAQLNQLHIDAVPSIGTGDESAIAHLLCSAATERRDLNLLTKSRYFLKFQAESGRDYYHHQIRGPIDISNMHFAGRFDRMVLDLWSINIEAKDRSVKSIRLARLAIGYSNLLIFVKSQNESDPPLQRPNLPVILAEFVTKRISDIISDVMSLVRNISYELDAESRSFMAVFSHYLSILCKNLRGLSCCYLYDDPEFFGHLQTFFTKFLNEQNLRLETDCKHDVDWSAAFDGSLRCLEREFKAMKVSIMKPLTLSVEIIYCNDDGIVHSASRLHGIKSTPQANMLHSRPVTKIYGELLETRDPQLSQLPITDTIRSTALGSIPHRPLNESLGFSGIRGHIYNDFRTGPAVAADRDALGTNGVPRNNDLLQGPSENPFETSLPPKSSFNTKKRDFDAFDEFHSHCGEWSRNSSDHGTWQTRPSTSTNGELQNFSGARYFPRPLAPAGFQFEEDSMATSSVPPATVCWAGTPCPAIPDIRTGLQPMIHGIMGNMMDPTLTQLFELDGLINRDELPYGDPQHDHYGYHNTVFKH